MDLLESAMRFRRIREFMGLTQIEAAQRLSVTQAYISKIERRPSIKVELIKLLAGDDYEVIVRLRRKSDGEEIDFEF